MKSKIRSTTVKIVSATIFVGVMLSFSYDAHAASYYFASSTGSDSNLGSEESPWKTIGKANSLDLLAGDTLYFNGGETFNDTGLVIYESGTAENPITITSYGTGRAIIDAMSSSTTMPNIRIYNASYITIDNITASSTRADRTGSYSTGGVADHIHVTATSSSNTRYTGIVITDNNFIKGGGAIKFTSPKGTMDGYDDTVVMGNSMIDQRYQGIYFHETDWGGVRYHYNNTYIGYNTISGALGDDNNIAFGIVTGNTTNSTIEHNIVSEIGAEALRRNAGPAGIFPIWSNGVTVQYNVVHHVYKPAGIDGAGIDNDFGNFNNVFQYNYVYDTEGESYMSLSANGTFRWNVGINGRMGMRDNKGGLNVYNNTFVCGGGSFCAYSVSGTNAASKFYNNVFYTTGTNIVYNTNANASYQGNLYYRPAGFVVYHGSSHYYSLADWRAVSANEADGRGYVGDPLLGQYTSVSITDISQFPSAIAAYAPSVSSDAIGTGLDLSTLFSIDPGTVDIRRDTLGTPYNIGAFDEVPGLEEPIVIFPTVLISTSTDVSTSTAIFSASIEDTGGADAYIRGFEYGTSDAYGIIVTESGSFGAGAFVYAASGLSCGTEYHVRSFASNSSGTSSSTDYVILTDQCLVYSEPVATVTQAPEPTVLAQAVSLGGGGSGSRRTYANDSNTSDILTNEMTMSITPLSTCKSIHASTTLPVLAHGGLFLGSRGDAVKSLQEQLILYGFMSSNLNTGYFGTITQDAVGRYNIAREASTASVCDQYSSQSLLLAKNIAISNASKAIINPSVSVDTRLQVASVISALPGTYGFTGSLSQGMQSTDVKRLQKFLNDHGFTVTDSGPGSKGNETTYYGPATRAAVVRFQETFRSEILVPVGLRSGTGFFGPATMKKVNEMI